MPTREEIIAAAKEAGFDRQGLEWFSNTIQKFYAIAFESGRVAEREACYDALQKVMVTDHSLRTYKRCLDSISARGDIK